MSPVDFSWSLESKDDVFYFTTNHIKKSQRWYQSIYQALPAQAKKPLPKSIELNIPELDMTIQLPLHELVAENNVALKSIRDSALALLHRYGYRPSDWNKQSVGLCWYYPPLQHLDWAIVPYHDQGDLIQPRLIEGIHRLELRHWHKRQEPRPDTPILIEGYLTHRHKRVMYAKNMDHYLLLYKITNSLCKTKKTSPLDNTTAGIVGMVDLTKMRRNQLWIDFDQHQYTFEPITLIESLYVPASYSKVVVSHCVCVYIEIYNETIEIRCSLYEIKHESPPYISTKTMYSDRMRSFAGIQKKHVGVENSIEETALLCL
ncbi:uncharacterized protein B0P05DRAFT_369513 [Gilbertella persicaria]|uniref:uncharacterized protein n=1 Tax=Gilbertella persicaria TaxID=101096 RepID=UPI0022200D35|nr:uncharacterized protein B0P05DRAFT_369513 [Gilbertella persicaria]KAI8087644.1 hypothetical protein B0P05DRAFT_369513 [Gilbertella persicaria]